MAPTAVVRLAAGIVGGLLVILNSAHLTIGLIRLHRALGEEPISTRLADPLKTGWVMSGTLCLFSGALLLFLLPDLAVGSYAAWKAAAVTASGLVLLGVAAVLATGRHFGLLLLSVMGLAVLVPLLVWRLHFQQ
jgi:hypothetical protein